MQTLLADLTPPAGVVLAGHPSQIAGPLLPEEAALVPRAIPRRLDEFRAGRALARAALGRLGAPPAPLLRREGRAPAWPTGFVGSLTHTGEYCAVAVGRAERVRGLGIDAEARGTLVPALWRTVLTAYERASLAALPADVAAAEAMVRFSAKESVFKCWSTLGGGGWLAFHAVAVEVAPDGTFRADFVEPPGCFPDGARAWSGRWRREGDLVLTAVVRWA